MRPLFGWVRDPLWATIAMVAITVILAALLWIMVAGLVGPAKPFP